MLKEDVEHVAGQVLEQFFLIVFLNLSMSQCREELSSKAGPPSAAGYSTPGNGTQPSIDMMQTGGAVVFSKAVSVHDSLVFIWHKWIQMGLPAQPAS